MGRVVTTKRTGLAGTGIGIVAFAVDRLAPNLPDWIALGLLGLGVGLLGYSIIQIIWSWFAGGRGIDDMKGWSVSARFGAEVAFIGSEPNWGMIGYQDCRFANLSGEQTRYLDLELHIGPAILRAPDDGKTDFRKSMDRLGHDVTSRGRGHIPIPIKLAPGEVVEGRIEFPLNKRTAAEVVKNDEQRRQGVLPSTSLIMIDMRTDQRIEVPFGKAYDAEQGKVVSPPPLRLGPGEHELMRLAVPDFGTMELTIEPGSGGGQVDPLAQKMAGEYNEGSQPDDLPPEGGPKK